MSVSRCATRPGEVEVLDLEDTRSVTVDVSVLGSGSSEPTIISASWRELTDSASTVSIVAPRRMTVTSSATDEHLVELVGDEDDREALGLELTQVVEQLVDLLRDEHDGRLVEDDDLGAAVEHLEDLDALAGADAEVLDQHVGLDAEAVGRRRSRRSSARASSPMPCSFSAPSTTFSRTVRLSASMKCWNTMPTPAAIASAGDESATCWPLTSIVPESGFCTPYRIFISVDLPAPFSPTIAWTVPRSTSMLTSWLATTPGNVLPMSRSRTTTSWLVVVLFTDSPLVRATAVARAHTLREDPGHVSR